MSERSYFRWKASSFSVSDPVRPHALYSNTGCINALYKRNRSCSLKCCLRNKRDHMERKAVTAFWRDRSSSSPSTDPSFLVVLHSSATRLVSRHFVDVHVHKPISKCCWCDLDEFAQVVMVSGDGMGVVCAYCLTGPVVVVWWSAWKTSAHRPKGCFDEGTHGGVKPDGDF